MPPSCNWEQFPTGVSASTSDVQTRVRVDRPHAQRVPGRCNCDAGIIGTDEGVLQGKQAGITSVVALHREGDVSGDMTISALECTGFVSETNAIRFQKPGSYLSGEWNEGTLSLQFRTADTSATLFVVNKGEKRVVQVELLDGHTMKVITDEGDMVIESQAK